MTQQEDIRWWQRFSHYQKALQQLGAAVELNQERALSEIENYLQAPIRFALYLLVITIPW